MIDQRVLEQGMAQGLNLFSRKDSRRVTFPSL